MGRRRNKNKEETKKQKQNLSHVSKVFFSSWNTCLDLPCHSSLCDLYLQTSILKNSDERRTSKNNSSQRGVIGEGETKQFYMIVVRWWRGVGVTHPSLSGKSIQRCQQQTIGMIDWPRDAYLEISLVADLQQHKRQQHSREFGDCDQVKITPSKHSQHQGQTISLAS